MGEHAYCQIIGSAFNCYGLMPFDAIVCHSVSGCMYFSLYLMIKLGTLHADCWSIIFKLGIEVAIIVIFFALYRLCDGVVNAINSIVNIDRRNQIVWPQKPTKNA